MVGMDKHIEKKKDLGNPHLLTSMVGFWQLDGSGSGWAEEVII